jgi:cytidylate kinase
MLTEEKRRVITIDGLAGSGKSSLAKALAARCGFYFLSSGLLYRAIGLLVSKNIYKNQIVTLDSDSKNRSIVKIDGLAVAEDLHTEAIGAFASKVAADPAVRKALISAQRESFPSKPIVAEGRDMGTVIFPEAPLKFFISAPAEVRAKRRMAQLNDKKAQNQPFEEILNEINARDLRDTERAISPTVAAADAITIENGPGVSLTEVVDKMYHFASSRGLLRPTSTN